MPFRLTVLVALFAPAIALGQGASDLRAAAQAAIASGPDRALCPLVTLATRLADGSLLATCHNGERMVVLNRNGMLTPMRCSAAQRQGIAC